MTIVTRYFGRNGTEDCVLIQLIISCGLSLKFASWTFNTKYYNRAALLATAGDLIFAGDLEGNVFALDAKTGMRAFTVFVFALPE